MEQPPPPPGSAPAARILPPLAGGDTVQFVYRAADGCVEAFVNGWSCAIWDTAPDAWVFPLAEVFAGYARIRLVRYEALVREVDEGEEAVGAGAAAAGDGEEAAGADDDSQ